MIPERDHAKVAGAIVEMWTERPEGAKYGHKGIQSYVTKKHGINVAGNIMISHLEQATKFSALAQATSGGWGYVSAKDVPNFDEGSTTITQVQGLRGCRNAGIAVPAEIIEKAKQYIYKCKNPDGGISYSSRNRGSSRPAITAAALAAKRDLPLLAAQTKQKTQTSKWGISKNPYVEPSAIEPITGYLPTFSPVSGTPMTGAFSARYSMVPGAQINQPA